MEFASALIWKKTQIDFFDSWSRKYFLYVKERSGYAETLYYFMKEFYLSE
jgi:hypothetical protein